MGKNTYEKIDGNMGVENKAPVMLREVKFPMGATTAMLHKVICNWPDMMPAIGDILHRPTPTLVLSDEDDEKFERISVKFVFIGETVHEFSEGLTVKVFKELIANSQSVFGEVRTGIKRDEPKRIALIDAVNPQELSDGSEADHIWIWSVQ